MFKLTFAFVVCVLSTAVFAAELLPPETPIEAAVDHYVRQLLEHDKVSAVGQIADENLIRRLTLDLAGRIPTTAEAKSFVGSTSSTKRVELVDRLVASPDFRMHHRNELDSMFQPTRSNDELRKYLTWAVDQGLGWDAIFKDMLLGIEDDEHQKQALQFLRGRVRNLDDLTNDTSVLFFGVNVSCAKCHDHPLVEDWKQDHYYGLSTFFSRLYAGKKERLGEKFSGEVKFKTTKGVEKAATFMFLTGSVVEEPKIERSPEDAKRIEEAIKAVMKDDNAPAAPVPEFSPRAKLVELALRDGDNSYFSKNIANRLWARLFGRGLVDPVDQLHSQNPASHPELLDWLARDLRTHQYDMQRLLRGLTLSQTYSRSSQWTAKGELPDPKYFAIATPRALSPRQYGLSLLIAATNPTQFPGEDKADEWKRRRESLEGASGGLANSFELPKEGFQVAVDEALLLSNSSRMEGELLRDSGDKLLGHLKTIPDQAVMFDTAYWAIVTRSPSPYEVEALKKYLSSRSSQPQDALKQAIWAVMTGPEMRFNY